MEVKKATKSEQNLDQGGVNEGRKEWMEEKVDRG